jgi:hypothetical protein
MSKRKMSRRKMRSKMLRAAAKTPFYWVQLGASKWTPQEQRQHNARKLGTFGPAGPCRSVKPGTRS